MSRAMGILALLLVISGCNRSTPADEYWASVGPSASVVLTLKSQGKAEYSSVSTMPGDGTMWFVHSDTAKWGLHPLTTNMLVPGVSASQKIRRYLWVSVDLPDGRGWRFDYADVGDKLFEVDKMGIQDTLFRVMNGARTKISSTSLQPTLPRGLSDSK